MPPSRRRSSPARKSSGTPRVLPPRASWLRLHADPAATPPAWLKRFDTGILALVAILMGWVILRVHLVGDYSTESDFYGGYAGGARLFQRLAPDPSRYGIAGPGYDVALALAAFMLRDLFLAGKLVSVLSALTVLVCWRRIARAAIGPVGASWLVVLIAANPVFFRYACSATTDMLAAALQAACLAVAIAGVGWRSALGAGALAALASLTRYTSVYLVPVTTVLLLVRPGDAARGRAISISSFLAGLALVAGPWVAYSLARGFVPGSGLFEQFGFYMTPGTSRNIQDQLGVLSGEVPATHGDLRQFLRQDSLGIVRRLIAGIPEHLFRDARELLGWPVAALCGVGLVFTLPGGTWRRMWPFAIPGAGLFLSLAPIFYSNRYSLPLVPEYLVLAAVAAASPWLAFELPRLRVALKPLAAAALLLVSAWSGGVSLRHQFASDPVEAVAAGRALGKLARPGDRVVSRKGHIGYYSGVEVVAFPRVKTIAELGEFVRERNARYLYYSWYEAILRPEFAYLLDSAATVPRLERVFSTQQQPAVLYRIEPGFGRDSVGPDELVRQAIQKARVLVRLLSDSTVAPYQALLAADALDHNRVAEAIEHAASAIRWQPREAATWTLMGDAQRAGGHLDDAQFAYSNALALDRQDMQARLGLGWVQLQQGRRELAAQTWRPLAGVIDEPATARAMADLFTSLGDEQAANAAMRASPPGRTASRKRP